MGNALRSCPRSGSTARKEREVMLRLKEVVDKQRDEIRAQAHEIVCKSRDTEAVSAREGAWHRFMSMNEELRHKVAVVQAQLKSALEKKSDLEAVVLQTQREMSRRSRAASEAQAPKPSPVRKPHPGGHRALLTRGRPACSWDGSAAPRSERAPLSTEEASLQHGLGKSPTHCCFSREELQQILQERNELKTNLFLVQEELAYYQRELLNEERIPSFFLDAMKSSIKKQRRKIRAKMLGTTEESASSDEDEGSWLPGPGKAPLPHTPICSPCSFGLWYPGSSKDSPVPSCSGAWEIIDSLEEHPEQEGEREPAG
ncbi:PREDICTED: rab-interacting lysosomal protein, partial [Tinamus guttatus]|uniref:rab-interacting lysosomal protein n=1 Tax=Tinamus guttatus TaxID=94827 RepID=UPI00052E9EE7